MVKKEKILNFLTVFFVVMAILAAYNIAGGNDIEVATNGAIPNTHMFLNLIIMFGSVTAAFITKKLNVRR